MPEIDFSRLPDRAEVPPETSDVALEATLEQGAIDFSGLPDKGESGVGEFEGKIPTVSGAPIAIGIDKSQRIDKGKILSLPVTNIGIDKKKMRDAFTDAATLSTLTGRKVSPSVAYKYRESLDKKANDLQDTWGQVFTKAGLAVGPSTLAGAAGLVREAEEFIQPPLPHEEFPEISLEGYKGPIPTRTTFGEEAGAFWAKKLKDVEIKSGDNTLKRYAGLITTNVLQNMPLLGIGAITGGSTIPLVAMGLITKGRKYQEMRDRGMDDSTARLMSTVVGVSEAATEKLGFDALIKSGIPFAKRLLLASGLDVPGELINTSIEAVVDKVSINPGMTYEEYVSSLIETAIVSLGSAGALTSISHPLVLMREQQEQRDKAFAEKQKEDTAIKGEEQDVEFKEGFGMPELPEELQGAYEESRMEAIEQGKSEDEATAIAIEAVSQTEEGKAYIDTVQQAIQPGPAPTLEETFGRITEEDLTEEELGAQFEAFAAGREIIGEEFPVSAPVAEIKQRLLDTGMSEEEAQTNAVTAGVFQAISKPAGISVETLVERYLPEVTREGVKEEVLEQPTRLEPWQMSAVSKEWADLGIDEMDRAAFGFAEEEITTLQPEQLNIKWQQDFDNVLEEIADSGLSEKVWAEKVDLSEPIEVIYEDGQFKVDDGYHRWRAATILNRPLNVELEIKDKPHRAIVEKALSEGKPVPETVLKPYPDLKGRGVSEEALAQEAPQEPTAPGEVPRGRIRITPDGITIELLKGADASTFVHEMGHLYFRMLADLSTLDTASEGLKTDFETIREWLGVPEGAETVSVEQQEQFARGFEAYLREGKAPTPALAEAFENFKQWLMDVYKSLRELNVELTDDVRSVFDRLLADEGVEVETLEQAPAKKDLQSILGNDTFNIEEIERRIENGLYVTDIIPEAARTKAQGSNIEAGSNIAKESLRSVRQEDASDFSRIENPLERKAAATEIRNAEVVALREYAEQNDLVLPDFAETLEKEGNRGGTENLVYRDKSTGRWMKANFFTHSPTFSELFDRIMIHNVEFESEAYQLEGFAEVGGEFLPVFSQAHIHETEIIDNGKLEGLASDTLESMGYVGESDFIGNIPLTTFISPEGVVIKDINSRNVTHVDGDVAFIDPVIVMDAETKEVRLRDAIGEAGREVEVLEQAPREVKPQIRKVTDADKLFAEEMAEREEAGEEITPEEQARLEPIKEDLVVEEELAKVEAKERRAITSPEKARVREITGQIKDAELRALRDDFVRADRAARVAFRAGKLEEAQKWVEKKHAIALEARSKQERKKILKSLKNIQKKNAKSGIAVEYKKKIDELLEGIDFHNMTEKKRKKLEALADYLEKEGVPLGIQPKYTKELRRLSQVQPKDMTTEDLKSLLDTIKHLRALGRLKSKLVKFAGEKERQEKIDKLVESTVNLDRKPPQTRFKSKTVRKRHDIFLDGIQNIYINTLHTFRVADLIDGFKRGEGENAKIIQRMNKAERVYNTKNTNRLNDFLEKREELIGDVELTEQEYAGMMIHARFQEGSFDAVKVLGETYGFKLPETIATTEQLKEFVPISDTLLKYIDLIRSTLTSRTDDIAALHEETTNEIFDRVDNYFAPLFYEREAAVEPSAVVRESYKDTDASGNFIVRTKKPAQGFVKSRVTGIRKVPRIDIEAIVSEAVSAQEWFLNMQPPLLDASSLVFSKKYQEASGTVASNWWKNQIDIVARKGWQAGFRPNAFSNALRTMRGNLNRGVLLFKASTVMMQPFAVFDAMAYAQAKYGSAATAEIIKEFAKVWFSPKYAQQIIDTSETLTQRKGGEVALEEVLQEAGSSDAVWNKIEKIGADFIVGADIRTAAGVRQAFLNTLKKMEVDNAAEQADFMVHLTQGSSDITLRPHVLASGEGAKTFFTFQTFFLNRWGLIAHDLATGVIKSDTYKAKVSSLIALGILMIAGYAEDEAREILNSLLGKDFKEKPTSIIADVILFIPEQAPYIGSIIQGGRRGFGGTEFPLESVLSKGIKGAVRDIPAGNIRKGLTNIAESGLVLYYGVPGTVQLFDILEAASKEKKRR